MTGGGYSEKQLLFLWVSSPARHKTLETFCSNTLFPTLKWESSVIWGRSCSFEVLTLNYPV